MAFVPFVETDQPTMAAFNEKFQQTFDAAVTAGLQIEIGSYVGNAATSKTLMFSVIPKIVFVHGYGTNGYETTAVLINGAAQEYTGGSQYFQHQLNSLVWGANSVEWTQTQTDRGLNVNGKTYRYAVIGVKEE